MATVEQFEEIAAINAEVRFITLELMKISSSQNKPFEKVLKEFVSNAYKTKRGIARSRA